MRRNGGFNPKETLEQLINTLKVQLREQRITDIIQVGDREFNVVLPTGGDLRSIKKLAELAHEDSEIQIKGIEVNFVDRKTTGYRIPGYTQKDLAAHHQL